MNMQIMAVRILSSLLLICGYISACDKDDQVVVLDFHNHSPFSVVSAYLQNKTLNMLKGSAIPFRGPKMQNVSVGFQVNGEKQAIFFRRICVEVKCVSKIKVDYYGPWKKDPLFDITNSKKWIEVPPTPFSQEQPIRSCRRNYHCFQHPGLLTNFTLTFHLRKCKSCKKGVITVRRLWAQSCKEDSVEEVLARLQKDKDASATILDSHFTSSTTLPGVTSDFIVQMLNSSGFEAAPGIKEFGVTFEVKNKSSINMEKICVTTRCVKKIKARYYGPWTMVSFRDFTGKPTWIESPPDSFQEEKSIKRGCRATTTCFNNLGNLSKFTFTFLAKQCKNCDRMRVQNLSAEEKTSDRVTKSLPAPTSPSKDITVLGKKKVTAATEVITVPTTMASAARNGSAGDSEVAFNNATTAASTAQNDTATTMLSLSIVASTISTTNGDTAESAAKVGSLSVDATVSTSHVIIMPADNSSTVPLEEVIVSTTSNSSMSESGHK